MASNNYFKIATFQTAEPRARDGQLAVVLRDREEGSHGRGCVQYLRGGLSDLWGSDGSQPPLGPGDMLNFLTDATLRKLRAERQMNLAALVARAVCRLEELIAPDVGKESFGAVVVPKDACLLRPRSGCSRARSRSRSDREDATTTTSPFGCSKTSSGATTPRSSSARDRLPPGAGTWPSRRPVARRRACRTPSQARSTSVNESRRSRWTFSFSRGSPRGSTRTTR